MKEFAPPRQLQRSTANFYARSINLKTLIYIYGIIYAAFSVWTIWDDIKQKEPWWDKTSDFILLPLGGVGILLFLFRVNDPLLKFSWKIIAIVIVAGQIMSNVIARHLTLHGQTDRSLGRVSQLAILGADLVTVLCVAPMLVLNLIFAFS